MLKPLLVWILSGCDSVRLSIILCSILALLLYHGNFNSHISRQLLAHCFWLIGAMLSAHFLIMFVVIRWPVPASRMFCGRLWGGEMGLDRSNTTLHMQRMKFLLSADLGVCCCLFSLSATKSTRRQFGFLSGLKWYIGLWIIHHDVHFGSSMGIKLSKRKTNAYGTKTDGTSGRASDKDSTAWRFGSV